MKKLQVATVLSLILMLSSCQAIEGIFKAGVWAGVIIVVLVIALIIFIISKVSGGRS